MKTQTARIEPSSRWLLAGCLFLLLAGMAGTLRAAVAPQEVVRRASAQVLDRLRAEQDAFTAEPGRLYQLVDRVLLTHMDLERMSQWVLGKHWRRASEAERARFTREFRALLVRSYASALAGYSGQEVRVLPLREAGNAESVVVRTEITQPAGPAIPVNYSLHLRDGDWKAYDVSIDGISLVANYRASFGAEIRRHGVAGLIESLAAQNRQALNGGG